MCQRALYFKEGDPSEIADIACEDGSPTVASNKGIGRKDRGYGKQELPLNFILQLHHTISRMREDKSKTNGVALRIRIANSTPGFDRGFFLD